MVVTGGANGYANPNKGENTLIGLLPSGSGTIEVKVYTLSGELVWETSVIGTANNTTTLSWNGKNSDGITAASGIYLMRVTGGGIDAKKKVAIIK